MAGAVLVRQGMQVPDHGLEPFLEDMGVDLRGRDIGMAEQCLHDAQIGAVLQQMARKGVPQNMRADGLGSQAALYGQRFQVAREMLPGQMAALAEGRKQPFRNSILVCLSACAR